MSGNISVIAIDGPVAAGKTVVGLALAQRLEFRYLDTGIMYRAIAWLALQQATPMDDEDGLGALAASVRWSVSGGQWSAASADWSLDTSHWQLNSPEVDRRASIVSQVSQVRRALVEQQRVIASEGRIVMAGRDIGSVVLPNADLKIFISASLEERARRRYAEQVARGVKSTLEQVIAETRARDDRDTQRADSPLVQAPDAWVICTDNLSVEDVVDMVVDRVGQVSQGVRDNAG